MLVVAWTVAFCPRFFEWDKLKYLEERSNGDKKSYADIASLETYERVIIHEYMHNDLMKFQPGHSKFIGLARQKYRPNITKSKMWRASLGTMDRT
jgi:hypothetical protein